MSILVCPTLIPDVLVVKPQVFTDDRGFFMESFNEKAWQQATGLDERFVQDNHSRSTRGVLRGLHYQVPPCAQGKLIRVVAGEIYDVAVDLRRSSPTFGRWVGTTLSADNKEQIWIPEGFAHGFVVTSDVAEVIYKTTAYYAPECERSLRYDDPDIDIAWPAVSDPILSQKDELAPALAQAELFD